MKIRNLRIEFVTREPSKWQAISRLMLDISGYVAIGALAALFIIIFGHHLI